MQHNVHILPSILSEQSQLLSYAGYICKGHSHQNTKALSACNSVADQFCVVDLFLLHTILNHQVVCLPSIATINTHHFLGYVHMVPFYDMVIGSFLLASRVTMRDKCDDAIQTMHSAILFIFITLLISLYHCVFIKTLPWTEHIHPM